MELYGWAAVKPASGGSGLAVAQYHYTSADVVFEFINDASDLCFTAASPREPARCFSSRVDDS